MIETHFPNQPRTFLVLLFEQLSENNETITSYMRYLREPKEYTGLPDSQVRIKVDPDGYENNHLTGIQKYINCSDGKNIVKGKQKFGMSIDAIFGIIFGSMLACCSLSIGLTAAYINFKNKYSKL